MSGLDEDLIVSLVREEGRVGLVGELLDLVVFLEIVVNQVAQAVLPEDVVRADLLPIAPDQIGRRDSQYMIERK